VVSDAMNFVNKIPLQLFRQVHQSQSLTTFVMHISKFSAPFCHTNVTHNIITIQTTQSTMNLSRALSCVKKTNHSTYLTAGGNSDDSVHVSSVITPTLQQNCIRVGVQQ
jgi:hypothetical protein